MKRFFRGVGSVLNFGAECTNEVLKTQKEERNKHALASEILIQSSRRVHGDDHPHTLALKEDLAGTLGKLGRHYDASILMAQVVASKRRTLGSEHPHTVACKQALDAYNSEHLISGEEAVAVGALIVGGWLGWKLVRAIVRTFQH